MIALEDCIGLCGLDEDESHSGDQGTEIER